MGCLLVGIAMLVLSPVLIMTGLLKLILGGVFWFLLLPIRILRWLF